MKAKVYLKQGRLAKALDWVRARGLSADDEISYLGEFEHLTLARVLMAEYQSRQGRRAFVQAIVLLERLLKAAEAQEGLAVSLKSLWRRRSPTRCKGTFPWLWRRWSAPCPGRAGGLCPIFVDEGEPMRLLILDFRSRIEKQRAARAIHCSFM